MKIKKNSVVTLEYILRDDEKNIIDQSVEGNPLVYIQGYKNIIPGLESELLDKNISDELEVVVQPKEGYGEYNQALEQSVPRENFKGMDKIEVGMQFQAETKEGPIPVLVTNVDFDTITIDGNHPLAGKILYFSVKIKDIREATNEEIERGYIAQDGGCCGSSNEGCGCS